MSDLVRLCQVLSGRLCLGAGKRTARRATAPDTDALYYGQLATVVRGRAPGALVVSKARTSACVWSPLQPKRGSAIKPLPPR